MNILFFINAILCVFIIVLMLYHIDLKWNPFGKLKCKIGIHRRFRKTFSKRVKTYHCVVCSKAKKHPRLEVVEGDKKYPSNNSNNDIIFTEVL